MVEERRIYKCPICENIVEVLYTDGGELICCGNCCGKPMILQGVNSGDSESQEKHVPVIDGNKVRVGSVAHPMEKKHYIMWIEAESIDGECERIFLESEEEPEAEFGFEVESARAYCNLHGLWESD